MQAWVASLVVSILTKLTSWLLARGLEKLHLEQDIYEKKNQIDERLKNFKDAYVEAFDGHPLTEEQRAKLKKAIADFIRGDGGGL